MNWNELLSRHFGAENVLWTAEEGPEPDEQELARRSRAVEARRLAARWVQRARELSAVRRMIAAAARGEETGLTPLEESLLPELLQRLEGEPWPDLGEEGADFRAAVTENHDEATG